MSEVQELSLQNQVKFGTNHRYYPKKHFLRASETIKAEMVSCTCCTAYTTACPPKPIPSVLSKFQTQMSRDV